MVQALVGLQMHRVEHLVHPLPLGPVEVPVRVAVRLLPAPGGHDVIYGIGEGRAEADGVAAARHGVAAFVGGALSCRTQALGRDGPVAAGLLLATPAAAISIATSMPLRFQKTRLPACRKTRACLAPPPKNPS